MPVDLGREDLLSKEQKYATTQQHQPPRRKKVRKDTHREHQDQGRYGHEPENRANLDVSKSLSFHVYREEKTEH